MICIHTRSLAGEEEDRELTDLLTERLQEEFTAVLQANEPQPSRLKLLLRFLVSLATVNVLDAKSVVAFLQRIVDTAVTVCRFYKEECFHSTYGWMEISEKFL